MSLFFNNSVIAHSTVVVVVSVPADNTSCNNNNALEASLPTYLSQNLRFRLTSVYLDLLRILG